MPSEDDDCQKNSIITSEKKDYDGTRFGLWFYKSSKLKKIHLKSYEILFLKSIFGKISVDAWDCKKCLIEVIGMFVHFSSSDGSFWNRNYF